MVKDMDDNEKSVPEEKKSSSPEKKLQLDLSQALTTDPDDDDDIIELKDEITPPQKIKESENDLGDLSTAESSDDEPNAETVLDLNPINMETAEPENAIPQVDEPPFMETAEPENVIHQVDELIFEEGDESQEDEEIQPFVFEKPLEAGGTDEVIEITEFDDIASEDANEMIALADEDE